MTDPIILALDVPIDFPGEKILTEIVLRPPTGADLLSCGLPFAMKVRGGEVLEDVNATAVQRLLARMANVPPPMIERMSGYDFYQAIGMLRTLFLVRTAPPSSTTSSRLEGGAAT